MTKSTDKFSRTFDYAQKCKECNYWLTLFRKVFGPVRNVERNREKTRQRMKVIRNAPVNALYEAFGIRRVA